MSFDLQERASGVLLHLTSLPGAHGCGDTGPEAFAFAEWLSGARQGIWQMLPVGPPGVGNSPYSARSAFAGNPLLVSIDKLVEEGLLPRRTAAGAPRLPAGRVDYVATREWRESCLSSAFRAFRGRKQEQEAFDSFCEENRDWLDDFSLYAAIKRARDGLPWVSWPLELRSRDPEALRTARRELGDEIAQQRMQQFLFARHWAALRDRCAALGVALVGDLPIYVAHDSAEVWAHPELFFLDEEGEPTVVAGVPPDYFSATGQRWGNPLYRWDELRKTGFDWWVRRIRISLARFDAVRLDHFIGFTRYWEVPAGEPTARNGRWRPGPGAALFDRLLETEGRLPFIAEDLGEVTPEVLALRDKYGLPGIKVLQFAFGTDPQAESFLPYNYQRNALACCGTHDNDTTVGWFTEEGGGSRTREQCEIERRNALAYLGASGTEIHWEMLRAVWGSVANLAVSTAQDLLGLGSEARMNRPGTAEGNWEWRLRPGQLGQAIAERLREMTRIYGRQRKG